MPAKVDADDRRRQLVLAAAELIADEGVGALTNGRLAERLSGSTTVVTHYFRSKRELLLHTYQTMASRSRARLEEAMRGSDDPLAACLHAMLPFDDSTRVEWRVWLAYQGMSVGDPELTRIWAARAASAVDRLSRLIDTDIAAGRMPSAVNPDTEGGRLFSLVQGMSFQSIVDPERWSPAHLRRIVDLELTRLRSIDNGRLAAPRPTVLSGEDLRTCTLAETRPNGQGPAGQTHADLRGAPIGDEVLVWEYDRLMPPRGTGGGEREHVRIMYCANGWHAAGGTADAPDDPEVCEAIHSPGWRKHRPGAERFRPFWEFHQEHPVVWIVKISGPEGRSHRHLAYCDPELPAEYWPLEVPQGTRQRAR